MITKNGTKFNFSRLWRHISTKVEICRSTPSPAEWAASKNVESKKTYAENTDEGSIFRSHCQLLNHQTSALVKLMKSLDNLHMGNIGHMGNIDNMGNMSNKGNRRNKIDPSNL